jgi:pimeloyl-ACP methyl ester carboxylesterase
MRLLGIGIVAALLLIAVGAAAPAQAHFTSINGSSDCQAGSFASGALWQICVPKIGWNSRLIVYAHGYVRPGQPLALPSAQLPDGSDLATAALNLGYAYATTSYHRNGLAIVEGVADIRELVDAFPELSGRTADHTYLLGVSEGGLIATQLAEQSPQRFSGVLAACAPIGDFRRQLDYFGDFRVLFDYFFPGTIPPSPVNIPQNVIDTWDAPNTGASTVSLAMRIQTTNSQQLISTAAASLQSPIGSSNMLTGTLGVLSYNIYATNDATAQLGGNPYDNATRGYSGSSDDPKLNGVSGAQRFIASRNALDTIAAHYQTSGDVRIPFVTIHTTGDEIVPIWHEDMYLAKARAAGRNIRQITVQRTGHCNFTATEMVEAFSALLAPRHTYLPLLNS